jgi:general secretion pathway protein C
MGRYLSWLANTVVFVLCCYLVADTANDVFAALLTPTADSAKATPARSIRMSRDWSDREIILQRNLFNASLLAGTAPIEAPVDEDLEETKLPLRLVGTAAASTQELSWAAVEDEDERETVIVRIDDALNRATVKRIERRRIVLSENGVLRELTLDDDSSGSKPQARTNRPRAARSFARARPRSPRGRATVDDLEKKRAAAKKMRESIRVEREEIDELVRNPANLLSQARILPKYEGGAMVGLQVNAIKPGSLLEQIGMLSGDVITKLNGVNIENPQDSARVLADLADADEFVLEVDRDDGTTDTLTFDINQ